MGEAEGRRDCQEDSQEPTWALMFCKNELRSGTMSGDGHVLDTQAHAEAQGHPNGDPIHAPAKPGKGPAGEVHLRTRGVTAGRVTWGGSFARLGTETAPPAVRIQAQGLGKFSASCGRLGPRRPLGLRPVSGPRCGASTRGSGAQCGVLLPSKGQSRNNGRLCAGPLEADAESGGWRASAVVLAHENEALSYSKPSLTPL